DGAGLAATARASPRRPARCGAARPVRRPAAGTAALGDRAPGRRRRRGGRPRDRTGGRAVTTPSPGHAAGGFPRFAVLMPLWGRDLPDRFELALTSATLGQRQRPDLLILTIDGPLPPGLEAIVERVANGDFGRAEVLRHDDH